MVTTKGRMCTANDQERRVLRVLITAVISVYQGAYVHPVPGRKRQFANKSEMRPNFAKRTLQSSFLLKFKYFCTVSLKYPFQKTKTAILFIVLLISCRAHTSFFHDMAVVHFIVGFFELRYLHSCEYPENKGVSKKSIIIIEFFIKN